MPDPTKPPEWMVRDLMQRFNEPTHAECRATIADLRDRLRIMARVVCDGCGCEARCGDRALCWDCNTARLSCVLDGWSQDSSHAAACVSVGLRALCGRRILEGCA